MKTLREVCNDWNMTTNAKGNYFTLKTAGSPTVKVLLIDEGTEGEFADVWIVGQDGILIDGCECQKLDEFIRNAA